MRYIIINIIVLSLGFINLSKADEIRELQIENISLFDSLTKYVSRDIIKKRQNDYKDKGYMYKSKDFYSITFFKNDNRYVPISNLKTFDELQFHLKDKDNTYKIHAVTGAKHMSDMNKCLQELNVIEKDFQQNLFKGVKKYSKNNYEHISKLGSVKRRVEYKFLDGYVSVTCETWQKSTGINDGLVFDIRSNEFSIFVSSKAF